jgi:aminocarboxymuconate-semialdehyde decarboxylase
MREEKVFWIDEDMAYMRQGLDWKRPITDPSFFLDEKLKWMDRNNIDREVVLNLSQLYCNGFERDLAKKVIQFQNDYNARIQAEYPDRFITGFVVQPLHLEDALEEIDRCVEKGMKLCCLPTHFIDDEGKWTSVVDRRLAPLWEKLNAHSLALEIHPYDGEKIVQLPNNLWRFHLVWMCAQTADTYHMFTMRDYPDRYPNIRTCFAHGNQFGQINVGRRRRGFKGRPDLFEGARDPIDHLEDDNVFFDTLVHDTLALEVLVRRQGARQIVWGLDDPYPLGEMETDEGEYPGKVLHDAIEEGVISQEEAEAMWSDNVWRWIYNEEMPQELKDK